MTVEQYAQNQTLQHDYSPKQQRAIVHRECGANAHSYPQYGKLLNNFNAINANAKVTTNSIDVTGIGAVARLNRTLYRAEHVNHRHGEMLKFDR